MRHFSSGLADDDCCVLSAGRGRPVRTPFALLVRALPVVGFSTECGASCLPLVGPRICWRVGGARDIPVQALFPQGRERFELASSSGWSRVLGIDFVGGPPYGDFANQGGGRMTSRCSPGWQAVTLADVIFDLVARPATLIIIDEAGMADTLCLDTAVEFAVDRGASVRLIGDDQQLAAIGAGGVLRDIKNIHGALHLTELHRFTDPAEAQASLALRDGDPSALGFYLDHGRVHVGDLAKITEDAFLAWISDRAVGLDAIMLAPTRQLVAELNRRAGEAASATCPGRADVRLGEGNRASVGDMIITRANDRRLRLAASDWVKNGDRWTITQVDRSGGLTVRHSRSQLKCQLPADYVTTSTGLGYATTVHGAQGVSADTMHGLLTGQESRQQLYTMLTRGRQANHLYLQVVGDGDPHSVIRPDTISPHTPTETLHQILGRDETAVSASTALRKLTEPATRLFQAVQRYTDGLHVATEQLVGPQTVAELDQADRHIPELTTKPAWPTLRAHLLALAAETGEHPLRHLQDSRLPVETSALQATWPPSSTGASQSSRPPTQVRCPGSRAFQKRSRALQSGGPTWQSDPS